MRRHHSDATGERDNLKIAGRGAAAVALAALLALPVPAVALAGTGLSQGAQADAATASADHVLIGKVGIEDYDNFDEDGNADPDKVIYSYDVHSDDEGVTANSWGGYTINIQKLKDYVSAHGYRFQAGLVGNVSVSKYDIGKLNRIYAVVKDPNAAPAAPTATDVAQAKVTVRSVSDATKSKDYSLTEGTYQIGNVIKTASGYTCVVTLPADKQQSYVDRFAKDEGADFASQGFSQIQFYFSYQDGAWTNTTTDQYVYVRDAVHTVTVDLGYDADGDGNEDVLTLSAKDNSAISGTELYKLDKATKGGCFLKALTFDADGKYAFDSTQKITKDTTLHAQWQKNEHKLVGTFGLATYKDGKPDKTVFSFEAYADDPDVKQFGGQYWVSTKRIHEWLDQNGDYATTTVIPSTSSSGYPVSTTESAAKAVLFEVTFNGIQKVETVEMYRLYNPNAGEHFYTNNAAERDHLVSIGWKSEGTGWTAPKTSKTPVYRLYNPNAGDHHYTTSAYERDSLVKAGWNDEGIGWYSDDAQTVPVYREYNPNAKAGAHNFTTNKAEDEMLANAGWNQEGIAWYAVK